MGTAVSTATALDRLDAAIFAARASAICGDLAEAQAHLNDAHAALDAIHASLTVEPKPGTATVPVSDAAALATAASGVPVPSAGAPQPVPVGGRFAPIPPHPPAGTPEVTP